MTKSKLEQNQHARPISLPAMTALTGFLAVFLGLIGLLSYFFILQKSGQIRFWNHGLSVIGRQVG